MSSRTLKAADLFCGAGGTSQGLVEGAEELQLKVELTAINHWEIAVATHTKNHPGARHLCASLDSINPRTLFPNGKIDLLWASPECTHHSNARGGKPIRDQSRATAWCVCRWAEALHPDVILVENVPEFRNWGPLLRKRVRVKVNWPVQAFKQWKKKHPKHSRKQWMEQAPKKKIWRNMLDWVPDPKHKGELFQAWVRTLESIGYKVSHRVLCAADYGDPTTRERLFIYCVRGRRKVIWPEPSHINPALMDNTSPDGDLFKMNRKPWKTARGFIDWTDLGTSIFSRKRPLAEKTLNRILIGLEKYSGLKFIIPQQSGGSPRSVDQPLQTVVTTSRGIALVQPMLRNKDNGEIDAEPFLLQPAHGNKGPNDDNRRSTSVDGPIGTVPCSNRFGVVQPVLKPDVQPFVLPHPRTKGDAPRSVDDPLNTVTATSSDIGVVQPVLHKVEPHMVNLRGMSTAHSVNEPAPAITAGGGHLGVVQPCLIKVNHGDNGSGKDDRSQSVDKPVGTLTCKNGLALAQGVVIAIDHQGGNGHTARSTNEPLSSVTTKQRHALVQYTVKVGGPTGQARQPKSVDEPMGTVLAQEHTGVVQPYLTKFNGTGGAHSVEVPIDTISTKERFGLVMPRVVIDGQEYMLDIYFRMLRVRELASAQGFPTNYMFTGKTAEQVKQIGNAVPRHLAKALVKAALSQNPVWWEEEETKKPSTKGKKH